MTARARSAQAAARPEPAAPRRAPQRRPAPGPRRITRRRGRARLRLRLGGAAIPVTAVLLGGIVWLNVTNLQLTNRLNQTQNATQSVNADSARLRAAISRRDNSVLSEAKRRLDMELPAEDAVTFVRPPKP